MSSFKADPPEEAGIAAARPAAPRATDSRHGRDMTVGSIPRHLVAFALPMLVGSALQTAYSFVNAIWVGQFLGTAALAAVTVSFPILFALVALGLGLTMATNVLIAQHFGARNDSALRQVVDNSVLLMAALSLVLTVAGEASVPVLLRAIDTPLSVLPLATKYLRVFLLGLPLGFGLFLIRSMLMGIGDSKTPLYFQSASILVNTVLDPLLMFGWVGFPRLGLNGTAWASVFAQGAALVSLLIYLRRKQTPVTPHWRHPKLHAATLGAILRIGLPAALQQGMVSMSMVFITGIVNRFGPSTTAAFGAASRIDQLAFMPAMSFSMAIATLAGQNIGAGAFDRVRATFRSGVHLTGGVTLLASVLAVGVPHMLLRIFTRDPAVIAVGEGYLRIVGAQYVAFAVMFAGNGIINGSGHTVVTTLISLLSLWAVRVPLAYWLSRHLHSATGIWYAVGLSNLVGMSASLTYYFSGRWRKPVVSVRRESPLRRDAPQRTEV